MGLDVSGSNSLYWKARIDTDQLQQDANHVQTIMNTVATFITGYMVKSIMDAALEADRANTKLAAAYKQTGLYSQKLMSDTIALSDELMKQVNIDDEVIKENVALMTVIGHLSADQIPAATKAAIGLSRAYGVDLNSAFSLVGRAAMGQTQMLARQGIVLKEGGTIQERFNELLLKGAEGFETAKKQVADATGNYEKMTIALGEMKESLGTFAVSDLVLNGLKLFTYGVQQITDYMSNLGLVIDMIQIKSYKFITKIGGSLSQAALQTGLMPGAKEAGITKESIQKDVDFLLGQADRVLLDRINENEKKLAEKYANVPAGMKKYAPNIDTAKDAVEAAKKLSEMEADSYAQVKKWNDEYVRQEEELRKEINELTATYETKRQAILTHYADLRDQATNQEEKKAIDKKEKDALNTLKVETDINQNKSNYESQWSEKRLQTEIRRLSQLKKMNQYSGEELLAMNSRIAELQGALDDKVAKRERETNEITLEDVKKMSDAKLQVYINENKKKLASANTLKNTGEYNRISGLLTEAEREKLDRSNQKVQDMAKSFSELGTLADKFDTTLGNTLKNIGEMVTGIDAFQQALEKSKDSAGNFTLSWGDISSGIGLVSSAISMLDSFFGSSESILERQAKIISRQEAIVNMSEGNKKIGAMIDEIAVYEKQITEIQLLINQIQKKYPGGIATPELDDQIAQYELKIKELKDSLQETFTGTTKDSIADSIASGFSEGLDSAALFSKNFGSLMSTAIIQSFKRTLTEKTLSAWYTEFADKTYTEGGLSTDEIKSLSESLKTGLADAETAWKTLETIAAQAGVDLKGASTPSGMSGAIAGITEQTAGLLEGQFNAMRIGILELVSTSKYSNEILTFMSEVRLQGMRNGIWEIANSAYSIPDTFNAVKYSNEILTFMSEVRLQGIRNGVWEIANSSYYIVDCWKNLNWILDAANRTADASEKYLPSLEYLKSIDSKLSQNQASLRAMGIS